MSEINIFEKAARVRLRFESTKGLLNVEDLFNIHLTAGENNLDSMYIAVQKRIKAHSKESYIKQSTTVCTQDKLRSEILVSVMDTRIAEAKALNEARENKARRVRLLGLIADKDDAADKGKSKEELLAELNALEM